MFVFSSLVLLVKTIPHLNIMVGIKVNICLICVIFNVNLFQVFYVKIGKHFLLCLIYDHYQCHIYEWSVYFIKIRSGSFM